MPEDPIKEESQTEEFGWEDLTSQDNGRPDMGEPAEPPPEPPPAPEPEPAKPQEQPAETPPEPAQEPAAAEPAAAESGAETPPVTEEKPPEEEIVYTLPGGKKVTQADLAKDPELLNKLVTHSNQLTYFQQLAEERETKLNLAEAEKRKLLDQYTEWEMQQAAAAQQQQQPQEPLKRPETKVLEGMYSPHLDKMVADGRLTEDQKGEFGNVISEYLFDLQNVHNLINSVVQAGTERFAGLEGSLLGEVVPDVQRRQHQDAVSMDQNVQQNVAARPGYESLAEPAEWNRLKLFIAEKVNASPRDAEGHPTFDPIFDGDTMAQMFDAMTGADTRAALIALKQAQEQAAKNEAVMAGGETSARTGAPPPKQPSPMTPEDEAMDFTDPSMATG